MPIPASDPVITPDLPDLDKVNPDCSTITDEDLRGNINSKWASGDINYSFSPMPVWTNIILSIKTFNYKPEAVSEATNAIFKSTVRLVLNKVQSSSNTLLNFNEVNYGIENLGNYLLGMPSSRGIYYYLGGSQSKFNNAGTNGFSQIRLDNNDNIKSAYVFLPNDLWVTSPAQFSLATITHETEHALGFGHLMDEEILEKLLKIDARVYCSVMPYVKELGGIFEDYLPSYAVYPGQLDKRMIELAYRDGLIASDGIDKFHITHYLYNAFDAMFLSMIISNINDVIYSFLKNLESPAKKKLFNQNYARCIADLAVLLPLSFTEIPPAILVLFAIASATRWIPENLAKKLPKPIRKLFVSNYNFYILNISLAILQGQLPLPMMGAIAASVLGTLATPFSTPSRWLAQGVNFVPRTLYHYCKPNTVSVEEVVDAGVEIPRSAQDSYQSMVDNAVQEIVPEAVVVVQSPSSPLFFRPPPRVSMCDRITGLFWSASPRMGNR